ESGQVDHHAVADHGLHARPQNPRRNQLKDELALADEDGMSGVVPTLVARDDVEALGQQVDYFALAFVAPLGAEHDHVAHLETAHPTFAPRTIVATGFQGPDARGQGPVRKGTVSLIA